MISNGHYNQNDQQRHVIKSTVIPRLDVNECLFIYCFNNFTDFYDFKR